MTISDHYDVAVAGAGPAGIAAALAAAGAGATVLLVERSTSLGGNVSQAFVHTICGLYLPSERREAVYAHAGIPRAFAETLVADGGAGAIDWAGSSGFLSIDPDAFVATAARLCATSASIDVRTGTSIASVTISADSCTLDFVSNGRAAAARCRTIVDATGDANAAALAGARTERAEADALQHPSYIFRVDDVDLSELDAMERARTTTAVARAARSGRLPASASSIVVRPATRGGSAWITLNRPKPAECVFDPLAPDTLELLNRSAREDAREVLDYLVVERAPFRRAHAGTWPQRIGIRETRRVCGVRRLELADVLAGTRSDDEACVSTWPVELWSSHERLSFQHTAGPASIPLGCLVADHPARRLAMAGRCASASHEALGAIRVIATAMAMGEAAGAACALAAASAADLSSIDPRLVRETIASGCTTAAFQQA